MPSRSERAFCVSHPCPHSLLCSCQSVADLCRAASRTGKEFRCLGDDVCELCRLCSYLERGWKRGRKGTGRWWGGGGVRLIRFWRTDPLLPALSMPWLAFADVQAEPASILQPKTAAVRGFDRNHSKLSHFPSLTMEMSGITTQGPCEIACEIAPSGPPFLYRAVVCILWRSCLGSLVMFFMRTCKQRRTLRGGVAERVLATTMSGVLRQSAPTVALRFPPQGCAVHWSWSDTSWRLGRVVHYRASNMQWERRLEGVVRLVDSCTALTFGIGAFCCTYLRLHGLGAGTIPGLSLGDGRDLP
jgi:hypothetical protein